MSEFSVAEWEELAQLDGIFITLAAMASRLKKVETVVVMPGVSEESRIRRAMQHAVRARAEQFICTGTNPTEREKGNAYDTPKLCEIFDQLYPGREPPYVIKGYQVGDDTRKQAMNAAKHLFLNPPNKVVLQTGGSWHSPRSYFAFLQAMIEIYESENASEHLPHIYPLLVDVGFGEEVRAVSEEHILAGYQNSHGARIMAETKRRLFWTREGHLANLPTVKAYLKRVFEVEI